jgi:ABC-type uncharacterized transport system substrate-binding protein
MGIIAGGLLATPLAVEGQPFVHRIGFISNSTRPAGTSFLDAFRLVAELVALKVEVIVLAGTAAARAALQTTQTIPIVATVVGDPVASGLVKSLAKPGGNLTGGAWQSSELITKQLQLLQEMAPTATRFAALGHSAVPAARTAAATTARSLGVKLEVFQIRVPADVAAAFKAIERGRAEALIVLPSPVFYAEGRRLAELAARHRLPAIYEVKECRQDSQRRDAGRAPDGAAHAVRAGHQPQDREGPRPDDPAVAPAAGGSGH